MCAIVAAAVSSLISVYAVAVADDSAPSVEPIAIDRVLAVLPRGDAKSALATAAIEMGDWSIDLAGVPLDGGKLLVLSAPPGDEPLLRHVRETLGRPVDLDDLILFLDDVAVAGRSGRRGEPFVVPAGRARSAGILVHPDDVFKKTPRRYAAQAATLDVDAPREPEQYPPALDGEPLGPRWSARYPNPSSRREMLDVVERARPGTGLAKRIESLLEQMEGQGAQVWLTSTVRPRERGYLMWGAYYLSKAKVQDQPAALARLDRLNEEWRLRIPIRWSHPDGATATQEAARQMADAYRVVYATESGAKNSSHYTGAAVDLVAVGLPRKLVLGAPDGELGVFDLSDPNNTRDLSLEPRLIAWIEKHFRLHKLSSDYPHWTDTK